jgi:hypothetical protein
MPDYSIFMIDDNMTKHDYINDLIQLLNEDEDVSSRNIRIVDGFNSDSKVRHKNPQSLIEALNTENAIFLLDFQFVDDIKKNTYFRTFKSIKNFAEKNDDHNTYKSIVELYGQFLQNGLEWEFSAWLLATFVIKRKKAILISMEDPTVRLIRGTFGMKFEAILNEVGAVAVSFPDSGRGGLSTDEIRLSLKQVYKEIKDYCNSKTTPPMDWRDFISEISKIIVHEPGNEKMIIVLLRRFLQMESGNFEEIFLDDDSAKLKKPWLEILKAMNQERTGAGLHVGWLLGYGIHRNLLGGKLKNDEFNKIWSPSTVLNITPHSAYLFGEKAKGDSSHKTNLERFGDLCETIFMCRLNTEDAKRKNGDNNLEKITMDNLKLTFILKINYTELHIRLGKYICERKYKYICERKYNDGYENDTSKAIFDFWALSMFTNDKKKIFSGKAKFNIGKNSEELLEISFGHV